MQALPQLRQSLRYVTITINMSTIKLGLIIMNLVHCTLILALLWQNQILLQGDVMWCSSRAFQEGIDGVRNLISC